MKKIPLRINFGRTVLFGDSIQENTNPRWLFLHGAGTSDRKRFEQLRILLLQLRYIAVKLCVKLLDSIDVEVQNQFRPNK